jgi:hypothetical protein
LAHTRGGRFFGRACAPLGRFTCFSIHAKGTPFLTEGRTL